jgi:hypothetical protein
MARHHHVMRIPLLAITATLVTLLLAAPAAFERVDTRRDDSLLACANKYPERKADPSRAAWRWTHLSWESEGNAGNHIGWIP